MKNQRIIKGFNRLAPVYNSLTRLVFGKSLDRAQLHFLNKISVNDKVLMLGGGSGNVLKALLKKHPALHVDYIDISSAMLSLAKKKTNNPATVNFIEGTEHTIPHTTYSIVITNFYLDLFADATLMHIAGIIKKSLRPSARWFVTDFVCEKRWHRMMLWVMYRFFRITTHIEAKELPDWFVQLHKQQAIEIATQKFYGGFIKSSVFQLP